MEIEEKSWANYRFVYEYNSGSDEAIVKILKVLVSLSSL